MSESKRKAAAQASNDENSVPGTHGPVSAKSQHVMAAILQTVREVYPDLDVALFVFERETSRYNYASTVDREDMNAVLKSFLARQDEMAAIDAAIEQPAKGSA